MINPPAVSNKAHRNTERRRRFRTRQRLLKAGVPVVVWLLAIVAALHLYRGGATLEPVTGYALNTPVTLAHLEPGVVREVHVDLYDDVARGQVVISLDDRAERIELAAVEKDVERLRAEVAAAQVRLTADNARATADAEDLVRRFAVDRAAAHVDYLTQLVVNACERNDVATETEASGSIARERATVLERKRKAFEEADRRWARYREHPSVETPYDPILTPLRLAIDVRQRDLERIVRRIDAHVLRAPIDGQVTLLAAHAGDPIRSGTPLAAISPVSTNQVIAYLPESKHLAAGVGATVSVRCLAPSGQPPREYAGTVVRLSAAVDEVPIRHRLIPTYPAWGRGFIVALQDDARLIPGEPAVITFAAER